MPTEHFCLKWNNFQTNIVTALVNLKLDEDFVDVTLSCEGKSIKAHRVILSACSDYFRDIFRDNHCNHPVVIIRDASFSDVEGLVRYVYRGEVEVLPERLPSFLKTAELLKIKGLAEQTLPTKKLDENEDKVNNNNEIGCPPLKPIAHIPCQMSPLNVPILSYQPSILSTIGGSGQQNSAFSMPSSIASHTPLQMPLLSQPTPTNAPGTTRPNKIISSPIRVPVPPTSMTSLGRSQFSSLAQYLSTPKKLVETKDPEKEEATVKNLSVSKRRKATPKKKSEHPFYYVGPLGDSSPPMPFPSPAKSLSSPAKSASPPSPKRSRSAEEDERPLEICEDSDKESTKSYESTEMPQKSFSPIYRAPLHSNAYQDFEEKPLIIQDKDEKIDDELCYGETLDLSRRPKTTSSAESMASDEIAASPVPQFGSTHLPILPLHINTAGTFRQGSISSSESITSHGSTSSGSSAQQCIPSVKSDDELKQDTLAQGLVIGSSLPISNLNSGRKQKLIKQKKTSTKFQRHLVKDILADRSTTPSQNTNQQEEEEDSASNAHPRNKWRCMQPRVCNFCCKTFSNTFNLKQHIVNVHMPSEGVPCTLCQKMVKNKWYLRKHLVTAHGAPLKRVKPDTVSQKKASNMGSKKTHEMQISEAIADKKE